MDREEVEYELRRARPKEDLSSIIDAVDTLGANPAYAGSAVLDRKSKRQMKKEFKALLKEKKLEAKLEKKRQKQEQKAQNFNAPATKTDVKTMKARLRQRDKELKQREREFKLKRRMSKDTINFIGYNALFKDGIAEVEDGLFSQTLKFSDISYQSAREDRQKDIFTIWGGIYDYFGSDTSIQVSVVNTQLLDSEVGNRTFFDEDKQESEPLRKSAHTFNYILNQKMLEGVSNIKRERYLTYTVSAPSLELAIPDLSRIRNDVTAELAKVGCSAEPLDGVERLDLVHNILRPQSEFSFDYDRDLSPSSGLTTKDYISPGMLDFKPEGDMTCFKTDKKYAQVLVIRSFGSELSDRALSDIVDLPIPMHVTWHIKPFDKSKAKDYVRQMSAWIDKEIIEEQRGAVQKGYDFTILPQELKSRKENIESLIDHLENKNQRLYRFSGYVYTYADTKEELDQRIIQIISVARRNSVDLETLDYRQREGLNSVLPFAHNHLDIGRDSTTAEAAMFMPFATMELDMPGGNFMGQNKFSNNLVMCNRKRLASPVGFICGKTGSGKSFFVKQEILGTLLSNPRDQVIIFDRAGEYSYLNQYMGGTEIKLGVDSDSYINPFDLSNLSDKSYESQIAFKVDAMLAQAAAGAAEAGKGLDEAEQSIITRAVEAAFFGAQAKDKKQPLLEDFYQILLDQPEALSKQIALRYERFTKGSMSYFNHETNVNWENRLVNLNLKELPDSLVVFALINLCEATRNQMYKNFERGIRTWIYIEEIQSLLKYDSVINYFARFANEARKFGGLLTGITQNSVEMLAAKTARAIVLNADFFVLLKQSALDRQQWHDLFSLSALELSAIDDTCDKGAGLLIAGAARVPFFGKFPKDNDLYKIFSTDPNEVEDAALREKLRQQESSYV